MKALLLSAVVGLAALVGGEGTAEAAHYKHHRSSYGHCRVRYKRVRVPYYRTVPVYDCYGVVVGYREKLCYRYKRVRVY